MTVEHLRLADFDQVPAEEIRAGDELALRRLGAVVVSNVIVFEDESVLVVYFRYGEETFENKARDRGGRSQRSWLVERCIPTDKGVTFAVRRGSPARAKALRDEMERSQHERWARKGTMS